MVMNIVFSWKHICTIICKLHNIAFDFLLLCLAAFEFGKHGSDLSIKLVVQVDQKDGVGEA